MSAEARTKSANFLSARILPVDAYNIRNGLFLSQPLRSPPATSVNVIENEDIERILEEAKYKSMEGQSARLEQALQDKFRMLGGAL